MFKGGRDEVEDEPRSGRPPTSTDVSHAAKVKELVLGNRRLTVKEISDETEISFGSCQYILTENLGKKRVASRLMPKLLIFFQKLDRRMVSVEMVFKVYFDPT